MCFEELKEILENEAAAQGVAEYEIYFTASESVSTETLEHEISSFSSGAGAGVSFRCIVGEHVGSASTELFEREELCGLVARAKANALAIESDIPAVIYGGSDSYATLEARIPDMPSAVDVKTLALELQEKNYAASKLIADGTQSGAFAEINTYELANSKGLRLSNTTFASGAFVQSVVNRDGEAQEAFDFCLGFENAAALPEKAAAEATAKLGAGNVRSGRYKTVINGRQMRALLAAFSSVFSGKNALLGLSLLAGKEGEKIASECVTLTDDPMPESSTVATPFDGEGVATYKKNVIENGVLKTLLYDIAYAAKAGVPPTANGQRGSYAQQVSIAPFCFYINAGVLTEKELLEKTGDGIYVTELKGLHAGADAVTGDFSIESAGFMIENGKLGRAVKGFTVAGNFFDLLKRIECVADNVKFGLPSGFTVFGSPDVAVGEMSVAGI